MAEFTVIPAGAIKRVCVQPNLIRDHARFGTDGPTITIVLFDKELPASEVEIRGDSRMVQSIHAPITTGAKVWLETRAEVAYR